MRVICQTVPSSPWMTYLRRKLPQLEEVPDTGAGVVGTYLQTLERQDAGGALHIEDDIILTRHFISKATAIVAEHPGSLVQFFSMRPKDLQLGSRWDRLYMMNQCHYIPAEHVEPLLTFGREWQRTFPADNGCDSVIRDYLKSRGVQYWLHVPSLVQHREAPSRLGPRSSKRQSLTFVDPDWP